MKNKNRDNYPYVKFFNRFLFVVMKKGGRRPYYRDAEFLKKIGENVRAFRLKKGMSQTELAFECKEVDYSQIARMERGEVNFTVSYLSLIAKVLEIAPQDLLDFK